METLIEHLVALDDQALARVWVDLNRWEWPRDLPEAYKPLWWDGHPDLARAAISARQYGFIGPLMKYAESRAGKTRIKAEWKHRLAPATPTPEEP
jgi:hypothetical protein